VRYGTIENKQKIVNNYYSNMMLLLVVGLDQRKKTGHLISNIQLTSNARSSSVQLTSRE
jgi:hypothetical protein